MAAKYERTKPTEQNPAIRAANFEEVSLGFSIEDAKREAARCINCKKPRCVEACPVSIKIPQFIAALNQDDFAAASHIISQDSSLPSVCGRVCPQEVQCEGSCILGIKGESVAIGLLERFVGDYARENGISNSEKAESNGSKVAIIGSGPAGLACATDLAKLGYEVTIFEALHKPGGVLQYGIPEFRLPKDSVVAAEISNLEKLGVKIECDVVVGRTVTIDQLMDDEGYKAVFVGSGAGLPKFMNIEGENLNGVVSANEFLTRANLMHAYDDSYNTPIYSGERVVVVGGGNVAMDAVRTAKRLGADASIVYRRSETELPARKEEIHHAKEEGINFEMLTNPVKVIGNSEGWVESVECVKMELGEPDSSGRRRPVEVENSNFNIECDVVIMALGTSPNPLISSTTAGLETNRWGCLVADDNGVTTRKGVFAGGDAVTGAATVILAMGAGRKAAAAIDSYIQSL